jgi:ADP-ribosylation factor-like protein 8
MGNLFSWLQNAFWSTEMEIAILGLQNAGKSSFVHILQTGEFDDDLLPTIGFRLQKAKNSGVDIKIWDLGGQSQFRQGMWSRYSRDVDAVVYVIDVSDPETLDLAFEELFRVLGYQELSGIPLLLLFNKMDALLGSIEQKNETVNTILEQFKFDDIKEREKGWLAISCKELFNVDKALAWLIEQSKKKSD